VSMPSDWDGNRENPADEPGPDEPSEPTSKEYLGDGAYVEMGYGDIVLTTSDGIRDTNRIVLGPYEVSNLIRWIERMQSRNKETIK
jgi:hypothetical protein